MNLKIKILIGGLIVGVILIGGWWIWNSEVCPIEKCEVCPIEKFAIPFLIKSVSVYKDHIVVQVDKDLALDYPLSWGNMFLELKEPSYTEKQIRMSEFKQTGRAELQIGEGLYIREHHLGYSASLKTIRGEVAYIEVEHIFQPRPYGEFLREKCIVKIDKIYKRPEPQPIGNLKAAIESDKKVYKIGEKIKIKIKLTNIGDKNVRIIPPYYGMMAKADTIADCLEMYDKEGKEMEWFSTSVSEFGTATEKDIILLKPNESWEGEFEGVIKEGEIKGYRGPISYRGYYIDFHPYSILFKEPGKYQLRVRYTQSEEEVEYWRKAFGFQDMLVGSVESSPITIEIIK